MGARFLAHRTRALLADEPGVGKTAQVVAACDLIGARRVLVVCPAVGIEHWYREFKRWSIRSPDIDVLSYDAARRLADVDIKARWDVLIPDETHYAKNPAAQRTHAIYGTGALGWHADRIWALSGTPAPNNASELWPMLRAFGKTGMGYSEFVEHFCHVDWYGKVRGTREDRRAELRAILRPFILRRLKKDIMPELGAIDIQEWFVEPRPDFVDAMPIMGGDLEGSYRLDIVKKQEAKLRAALAGKSKAELLSFLAGHTGGDFATLRRYNAILKAPAVFDQVKFEIDNGLVDKIVIYGYHIEAMQILREKFRHAGIGAELIYGGTPAKKRDAAAQRWKLPSGPQVMIASIIAAGVVLDFSAAHQGIMIELDWVPGNNAQAMQRMHRHGQDKPVTVRIAIGSEIDEIVSGIVASKARELTAIFD